MKKFFAVILCVMMLSALALVPVTANQVNMPTAYRAATPIEINGVRDDIYGDQYFLVNSFRGGTPGAYARVWAAWDENYIYYYVEVVDTTPNHEGANPWYRDNIEFYLDWNSARAAAHSGDPNPYWQIRIVSQPQPGETEQLTIGGNFSATGGNADDIRFVTRPLVGNNFNGGYIVEVAMPVSGAQGVSLSEGMTIYVDFQVGDNQAGAGRTSQAFIMGDDPDADNQWQWPHSLRGILTLGAAPAPPPPPVADAAPAIDDTPGAPAPQAAAPRPAPRTFDPITMIALGALTAGAGVVAAMNKKRK